MAHELAPLEIENLFVGKYDNFLAGTEVSDANNELIAHAKSFGMYTWIHVSAEQQPRVKSIRDIMIAAMYSVPPSLFTKQKVTAEEYQDATERDLPKLIGILGKLTQEGADVYLQYQDNSPLMNPPQPMARVHTFDVATKRVESGVTITYPRVVLLDSLNNEGGPPEDKPMYQSSYVTVPTFESDYA